MTPHATIRPATTLLLLSALALAAGCGSSVEEAGAGTTQATTSGLGGAGGTGGAGGATGGGGASVGGQGQGGAGGAGTGGGGAGGAATSAGGSGGSGGSGGAGGAGGSPLPPPFAIGHVFLAGSRNAEVFEYDADLQLVTHWTDPHFGTVLPFPGQNLSIGPAGMVFDVNGHLVVASHDSFCVFSAPGQLLACHAKFAPEATENVIFDAKGRLYTTTATGGTNVIRVYDADYNYLDSHTLPTDNLTGVTCDPKGDLYIASQTGGTSLVYKVDRDTFTVLDTLPIQGVAEGLQFASDGNLLVALDGGLGVQRVHPSSPTVVVSTISDPELTWAVPITTDEGDRVYTADYENGSGTAPADLFVFDAKGVLVASHPKSEVWGPFGMVVAGAVLPCGAYHH